MNYILISHSVDETYAFGQRLVHYIRRRNHYGAIVVCLSGELGSGKSTFAAGIARELGITTRVLSPTFLLTKRYELPNGQFLYHLDLYRLEKMDDSFNAELIDWCSETGSWVVIEWPEHLRHLPSNSIFIRCEALSNGSHKIITPFEIP